MTGTDYIQLKRLITDFVDIDELNFLAKRLDSFDNNELNIFEAVCEARLSRSVMDMIILMLFEDDFLDDKQIKALLRLERPLSACYDEWLKNDCSYMDMLRDTVDDFSKDLVNEHEKAKKKKRFEPER